MLFESVITHLRRFGNQRSWERQWRRPDFTPGWLADAPRPFVLTGFADGWLAPGMTVLEIGCGRGNTAIWLARRGLKVLGIDISEHVIRQARQKYSAQAGLTFAVVDICSSTEFDTAFDVIVDTGCLQHLSTRLRHCYRENILRASHAGTRFVVTMHTADVSAEVRRKEVLEVFGSPFELVHTQSVPPANATTNSRLNAVFHFVRREV
jgi:2-polyprenyl-3-methyl-5-hydroxy-6-metoxy-1,4-benzoquinol methylase